MVATLAIIQDGENKETLVTMNGGIARYNGKNYYSDPHKSYKIGNDTIYFFNAKHDQPITLPRKDKIIITRTTNYRKKLKELFGRIEVGNPDGI